MSNYRVCKTDTCFSLRGTSTLTYDVGVDTEHQIYIRITKNSGSGTFDGRWISVTELCNAIDANKDRFASTVWKPLFRKKDNNTAGFLMAVLRAEGIVETAAKVERKYHIYHRRTDKNISSLIEGLDCTEK
jgi:hypothetical protein